MNDAKNRLREDRNWIVLLVVLAALLALGVTLYTRMSVELDAHPKKTAAAVYRFQTIGIHESGTVLRNRGKNALATAPQRCRVRQKVNEIALHFQESLVIEQDLLCLG